MSAPEFFDLQERSRSFEALAVSRQVRVTATKGGEPELFSGAIVSAEFFHALGVQPMLGRAFTQAEDKPGAAPVAILSHALWQRRWGGDAAILGETIDFGRTQFTIVGIMPRDFQPPEAIGQHGAEIWIPFSFIGEESRADRIDHFLQGIGRLRPGVSLAAAQAEVIAISEQLAREFKDLDDPRLGLSALHRETVGNIGKTLLPLFGAVGLLLLIACTNVANLLLIRAGSRSREMALRTAIGAGRGRIFRQLLTESLILGLVSGCLGVAVASAGVRTFVAFSPADIPRLAEVGVDGSVLTFTVVVSILTSLLFGLVPALRSSRPDLAGGLKDGAKGTGSYGRLERLRSGLVIAETSIAFVLVVAAGLLINSFVRLQRVETGFDPKNVQVLAVASAGESGEEVSGFYNDVMRRMEALPGVIAVGVTANLPLSGRYAMRGTHRRPMDIVVRTAASDVGMLPAMRELIHSMRPDVPIRRSVRMEDFVASSITAPRFYTLVLGCFAAVALLLAVVGIYGTVSYAVAQRSHEFGVRMALGATASSVVAMVLRRGMKLVVVGVILGFGAALMATRVLESFVFGVTPTDGVTLAVGAVTVLLAAFLASSIPARRATKLDPIAILRSE